MKDRVIGLVAEGQFSRACKALVSEIKIKIKIKQCGRNTILCPLYRGCELIVAKSGEIKLGKKVKKRRKKVG